jgi:hypothetical protein
MIDHPNVSLVESVVHILGIPGIIGALVWVVRKWDKAALDSIALKDDTTETRRMTMEALSGITEIKENHLAHLTKEIQAQTPILTNMDKTLAVIAVKLDRP